MKSSITLILICSAVIATTLALTGSVHAEAADPQINKYSRKAPPKYKYGSLDNAVLKRDFIRLYNKKEQCKPWEDREYQSAEFFGCRTKCPVDGNKYGIETYYCLPVQYLKAKGINSFVTHKRTLKMPDEKCGDDEVTLERKAKEKNQTEVACFKKCPEPEYFLSPLGFCVAKEKRTPPEKRVRSNFVPGTD